MTRRERLERKAERRRLWAAKAAARGESRFNAARQVADQIPLGQPILVGHHSERHARADQKRIHGNMAKGVEEADRAQSHESKAEGLERQLDRSIYSDDTDAVEALQARIEERKAEVERIKYINKEIRKCGLGWEARLAPPLTDKEKKELIGLAKVWAGVYKPGYPPYHLTNLNGRIRADKERLAAIQARTARAERAEASGGVCIEGDEWVRVTLADKPAREVLDALKAAGFCWSRGSWLGKREAIPAMVTEEGG